MIRKGEAWGEPATLQGAEPVAHDDAALARILTGPAPPPLVLLSGGDLYRSLGGQAPPDPIALPIDVLAVDVDGTRHVAVAHVVARGPLWQGPFAVAMNGTNLGAWNLGPKAHPNDGLVDVTRGELGWRDRLAARRRAPSGSHVPHPALRTERVQSTEWRFERPRTVYVDGVAVGRAVHVVITVEPDRGTVVLR